MADRREGTSTWRNTFTVGLHFPTRLTYKKKLTYRTRENSFHWLHWFSFAWGEFESNTAATNVMSRWERGRWLN